MDIYPITQMEENSKGGVEKMISEASKEESNTDPGTTKRRVYPRKNGAKYKLIQNGNGAYQK